MDEESTVHAVDATGEVTALVDADGWLEAVLVGFTWDAALTADELPGAVLEAVAEAHAQQPGPVRADAARGREARSLSGHARAVAHADGRLEELDLDPSWVIRAHPADLGREITEVVLAAVREARSAASVGR